MKNKWRIYKHPQGGWALEHKMMGPWALALSFQEMMSIYPYQIRQFNKLYNTPERIL